MKSRNHPTLHSQIVRTIALSMAIVGWKLTTPIQAQTYPPANPQPSQNALPPVIYFEPPNDDRVEGDSRGGASRPAAQKCQQDAAYQHPMTPLLPTSSRGLTVTGHPTIFVYVPPTSAPSAYFIIKDDADDREIYHATLPLTQTEGIVSIGFPESEPPLEVGKTYRWFVGLLCQPSQTDLPWVEGSIERIELDGEPNKASLEQQAVSYGASGIWYDTIGSLAQLVRQQPNNETLSQNWSALLDSVGLEAIADRPLL
ncbi:MAG: DUF928 domain-containing protein [Cyanobacteriota bacterium]|nr:DUF928 domain-containing protein [Cyanobacteriota bacterium]